MTDEYGTLLEKDQMREHAEDGRRRLMDGAHDWRTTRRDILHGLHHALCSKRVQSRRRLHDHVDQLQQPPVTAYVRHKAGGYDDDDGGHKQHRTRSDRERSNEPHHRGRGWQDRQPSPRPWSRACAGRLRCRPACCCRSPCGLASSDPAR
jgi:hypothetical protein